METTTPESVGMSAERLGRIAPYMEDCVRDNRLPGILTLIQRRGQVVHLGQFGMMDIAAGRPMQEDAIFRIYSMTKPIVSVALMTLYEEGRLSLNDPVAKFVPAFSKTKVYAGSSATGLKLVEPDSPMTIHHLLTHTSGLSYGFFFDSPVEDLYRKLMAEVGRRDKSLQEVIECIAELPLLFQPGTQWRYSLATDVLGYVIQVVTGRPLTDFLNERIFTKLGMIDMGFDVAGPNVPRLAQLYTSKALYDPFPVSSAPLIGDVTTPTQFPSGGAGLLSTLADYLKFCNCLLNQGAYEGGRLISRKTLAWMTANHIPDALMPIKLGPFELDFGFGLGFRVTTELGKARSLTSVGEYGWAGAANTYFWIDPAEDVIGILLTQHLPVEDYPVHERFRTLANQAIVD